MKYKTISLIFLAVVKYFAFVNTLEQLKFEKLTNRDFKNTLFYRNKT